MSHNVMFMKVACVHGITNIQLEKMPQFLKQINIYLLKKTIDPEQTNKDVDKLRIFERKFIRKMYGHEKISNATDL